MYFDDLVMKEIISYCGLKQSEDKFTLGVYVLIERVTIPILPEKEFINSQLYVITKRTENNYVWISNNYCGDGWSKPRRMKIHFSNNVETLEYGKCKGLPLGLPLTPKSKLDTIFTQKLWETLTTKQKLERYLKMTKQN